MNYSSCHKWFANSLNCLPNIKKQDVLDHPENYLGPNYKEVLNWWFYKESLSDEQWDVYRDLYFRLECDTWKKAWKISRESASEVIVPKFVCYLGDVDLELIAAHLYIERGIHFTILPLFLDL